MTRYQVAVLGVGAMGAATCWRLAARGARVLGIEQFQVGHDRGSSHGESRLIRQAYFEHPAYVPLLRRAYELWDELDQGLLQRSGLVIFGNGRIIDGIRASSAQYAIKITEGGPYPQFRVPAGFTAIMEPGAGYLPVERCVVAMADAARTMGATLKEQEQVVRIEELDDGVRITSSGSVYDADELVITAGAWSSGWLPDIAPHLAVHRVLLHWFPASPAWRAGRAPCFGFELPNGFFYGVPDLGRGVKVGLHLPGERVEGPGQLRRTVTDDEAATVTAFVKEHLPGVEPKPAAHAACMYTMTPDEHFVVGRKGRVSYGAGFSGHGFKFAPVMGEALADLALDGRTALPVQFLAPRWGETA